MAYLQAVLFVIVMIILSLPYFTTQQLNNYRFKLNKKSLISLGMNAFPIIVAGTITLIIFNCFHNALYKDLLIVAGLILSALTPLLFYLFKRNKFVFTARGKRLVCCFAALTILLSTAGFIKDRLYFTIIIYIFLLINPLFCVISHQIILPFENKNNKRYIQAAKKKLNDDNLLLKIGITGSYGKTGCKNILASLLSKNYNVYATKLSYNTPLGIAKAVNEMPKATDIFIAEMGARKKGDIAELMDIIRPKYGILTGITLQHLETFKTVENIAGEKFELAKLLPKDGFCVFNGDNFYTKEMYSKIGIQKNITGTESRAYDIYAENISLNKENGSSFDIVIAGRRLPCKTKLLGIHNIQNILLCVAIATKLGVEDNDIISIIAELTPVKHRMELMRTGKMTIIDDSYNCNIEGAVAAFEVLKNFNGRKVVFSQGIVELGKGKQKEMNVNLGKLMAKACDLVLLCGSNSIYIKEGLIQAGFFGGIHIFRSLKAAQKHFAGLLKFGDILLIQNDLPDNY